MTHTLIPRSGTCSAKVVSSLDFEKYWTCDIIQDYVKSGFTFTAQCPAALAVDMTVGIARLKGLYLENTVADTITCLTACDVNYFYLTVDRDCCCRPKSWSYTKTLTTCIPVDSLSIGNATTNACTVTAVCNTPTNRKSFPFPVLDLCYGDGSDGCVTNPNLTFESQQVEYCNVTFTSNTNITAACMFIRVKGTFTINSCVTITVTGNAKQLGGLKGCSNTGGGCGGAGGRSESQLIIMAKKIAGTGTIVNTTALSGGNGGAGTGDGTGNNGTKGFSGCPEVSTIWYCCRSATGGFGSVSGGGIANSGGNGGGENICTVDGLICFHRIISSHVTSGAGGGGGGQNGSPTSDPEGSTGGGGGGTPIARGGNGGQGGAICNSRAGMGGGGGGGTAASLILISCCISAINVTLTGGDGGNGGAGFISSGCAAPGSGGGGGGSVSILNISPAALTGSICLTAGCGGCLGAGINCCCFTQATNGDNGTTKNLFIDINKFKSSYFGGA